MSILFALAAAIGWGSSDFAAGHASRKSSAVSVVILTHFAAFVALVAISLVPGQGGSPGGDDIVWGLAAGLGGGFGAMLLFRGLGKGSMAVVAPITATGAATIPVVAGLIQGESISLFGIVGVTLALVAIVMVSLAADDGDVDADVSLDVDAPVASDADAAVDAVSLAAPLTSAPASFAPPVAVALADLSMERAARWMAPVGAPVSVTPPVALQRVEVRSAQPWPAPPAPVVSTFAPPTLEQAGVPAIVTAPAVVAPAPAGGVALLERPTASLAPEMLAPPTQPLPGSFDLGDIQRPEPTPPMGPDGPDVEVAPVDEAPTPSGLMSILNRPGVVDALLSGVGFGLFFVFISRTAESAGHWPLVVARLLSAAMFFAGAMLAKGAVLPERGSRRAVILAGLLDAGAAVFFVLSTRAGLLSVGAVLASLYPAATIVLARVITKERITRNQVAGLVLAGLAITLLAI